MGSVLRRQCSSIGAGVLIWAAVLLGLVACGDGHSDLTDAATRVLQHDVDGVTAAATAGDVGRVQQALQQLRRDVARQQHDGGLSAARAARILAASTRVGSDVSRPPSPGPTPTAPPPTAPATELNNGDGGGRDSGAGRGGGGDGGERDGPDARSIP